MEQISIEIKSNQNASFVYGTQSFDFRIYSFSNFMFLDLSINGELEYAGLLCTPNNYILPFDIDAGNFMFVCTTDDYPYYTEFNKTQTFNFVPTEEIVRT